MAKADVFAERDRLANASCTESRKDKVPRRLQQRTSHVSASRPRRLQASPCQLISNTKLKGTWSSLWPPTRTSSSESIPNAQAQKATEAASAAQAAAAQAAAAAELTVAAKPLLDKLDAIESRLKAIENKQGSCCVVS